MATNLSVNPERCTIQPLDKHHLGAAAAICARAMNDNPIHIQVFGTQSDPREKRLKRFFPALLAYVLRKHGLYGAFHGQTLVGVLGMLPPNNCKPSLREIAQLLPTLLTSTPPTGTLRLAIWLGTWTRIDPSPRHWHLGPLAVEPAWQQKGIGTQLIHYACKKGAGENLYLETDKLSNVEFYERFGFSTLSTPTILATPSWTMMRPALVDNIAQE